ncbi:MAG: hypothetical protein J6D34_06005 [Atopobiaceae bacterium]|nr:hypothetical protein [Atopobiaceae bacterium]
MYAFLSHTSALDALRTIEGGGAGAPLWPAEPRELPRHRNTVTTQRMFKELAAECDLASYGITRVPVDLLVPKASQRSRGASARFHAWKGDIPNGSMIRLEESLFVSTPPFILLQMAGWHTRIQPTEEAFVKELRATREAHAMANAEGPIAYDDPFAWEQSSRLISLALVAMELMGTYRMAFPGGSTRYQQPPLLTATDMRDFLARVPRAYGQNRLDIVMGLAIPHSASPMETALALMLGLPEAYGGYGLPQPQLNRSCPVANHERLWDGGEAITPDLLWEDAKLVIEYDSDEMHGSAGPHKLAGDATRANVLSALGYTVLRMTTLNIQSQADVERLATQVAGLLGRSLPEPSEELRIRRSKLHTMLMRQ